MTSKELVTKTIRGENHTGVTPMYAWVWENMTEKLTARFGSIQAFHDAYDMDMAMVFGGPTTYNFAEMEALREREGEITPEMLLDMPQNRCDDMKDYADIEAQLKFHGQDRQRFCYVQTNGIFEVLNGVFGIEDHLCWLVMYPDELAEVYRRQTAWNKRYISNIIELGADMVHISDDWGAQTSLMFSPKTWWELIYPRHREMVETIHAAGRFASLHSDGNVMSVLDGIVDLGYDLIHPFQESAGMDYGIYLRDYADAFAIMGGLCIQTTLGFGDNEWVEHELRRVFALLKNKRWVFCTTHLVQAHCSVEELVSAYDLAKELCGK